MALWACTLDSHIEKTYGVIALFLVNFKKVVDEEERRRRVSEVCIQPLAPWKLETPSMKFVVHTPIY
jgi:hypothetical protein